MKRYIKASFDNDIPTWLRDDKGALNALNKAGVDLKTTNFSSSREGRVGDNYTVYLVKGTKDKDKYSPFVWIPGLYNDDNYVEIKDYNRRGWIPEESRYGYGGMVSKAVKYVPKKELNFIDTIYINKNSNAKSPKYDKYQDPRTYGKSTRYSYAGGPEGKYAGQYYQEPRKNWNDEEVEPGKWVTPRGRDKSGYEIPDPKKRLEKFYNTKPGFDRRLDKVKKQVDDIYAQLVAIKVALPTMMSKISDDPEFGDYENYRSISRAYDYFGDAVDYYKRALSSLQSVGEVEGNPDFWDRHALNDVNSYLDSCQSRIDKVNQYLK
jgi:hypothetical protein